MSDEFLDWKDYRDQDELRHLSEYECFTQFVAMLKRTPRHPYTPLMVLHDCIEANNHARLLHVLAQFPNILQPCTSTARVVWFTSNETTLKVLHAMVPSHTPCAWVRIVMNVFSRPQQFLPFVRFHLQHCCHQCVRRFRGTTLRSFFRCIWTDLHLLSQYICLVHTGTAFTDDGYAVYITSADDDDSSDNFEYLSLAIKRHATSIASGHPCICIERRTLPE